jgi:hypothetical protein
LKQWVNNQNKHNERQESHLKEKPSFAIANWINNVLPSVPRLLPSTAMALGRNLHDFGSGLDWYYYRFNSRGKH